MKTTAAARAITNNTTMANSMPTALEVIRPSSLVEAITNTAWRINTATVMKRAVSSFSAMPISGMSA